jgi:hypothetical protein
MSLTGHFMYGIYFNACSLSLLAAVCVVLLEYEELNEFLTAGVASTIMVDKKR